MSGKTRRSIWVTVIVAGTLMTSAAQGQSARGSGAGWGRPILIGAGTGAAAGALGLGTACLLADDDDGTSELAVWCAGYGVLIGAPLGMLVGATVRAAKAEGLRASLIGAAVGAGTGALVGLIATSAFSGGDRPLDGVAIGAASFGGAGLVIGTVVGLTTRYGNQSKAVRALNHIELGPVPTPNGRARWRIGVRF